MESLTQLLDDLPDDRAEAVAVAILTYDRADPAQRMRWFAQAADRVGGGSVAPRAKAGVGPCGQAYHAWDCDCGGSGGAR